MKSLFALEELEIEKVLNQQQQANSGNEFDNLYYEAQQKQKLQEVNSEEESIDDNEPVDEGSEVNDSSEETEASEPDEEQVATEAISQHSYHIVQEELPENLITIKDGLIYIGQAVFGVAKYFTVLGIEHIPKLLGRLYKGVVYVLSRIAKLFTVGLYRLEKYIEKRKYAIAQFKSKIESAEKALQAIQNKDEQVDLTDQKYTDVKNINMLKISEEIDFIKTVNAYNEFLDNDLAPLPGRGPSAGPCLRCGPPPLHRHSGWFLHDNRRTHSRGGDHRPKRRRPKNSAGEGERPPHQQPVAELHRVSLGEGAGCGGECGERHPYPPVG